MKRFKFPIAWLAFAAVIAVVVIAALIPRDNAGTKKAHGHGGHDEHGSESVEINDAKVVTAGIELAKAGPTVLRDTLLLNGILQPNQETLVQVTPRFPGITREVRKRIGDRVEKDEVLARIESNQSLTVYEMKAPFAGTIIDRQVSLGEYASEQKPAFVIADLSSVWVDLSVYRRDLKRVSTGDTVLVDAEDGGSQIEGKISYVSPMGSSDTQSALARVVLPNGDMRLRPGLFVNARVVLAAREVAVAVKASALQTLETRSVVFVRNGQKFEARDIEIGQRDRDNVEIVFGILDGDVYAAKNSFIVKAELAKGSAAHEH